MRVPCPGACRPYKVPKFNSHFVIGQSRFLLLSFFLFWFISTAFSRYEWSCTLYTHSHTHRDADHKHEGPQRPRDRTRNASPHGDDSTRPLADHWRALFGVVCQVPPQLTRHSLSHTRVLNHCTVPDVRATRAGVMRGRLVFLRPLSPFSDDVQQGCGPRAERTRSPPAQLVHARRCASPEARTSA